MTTVRLDHLRVDVADLERAETFYRDALDLRRIVRYETDGGVILQMGPGGEPPGVELWFEVGSWPAPSATEHVAFAVDDVPALVRHVRSLGYEVAEEPRRIGGETVAVIRDPDGHLVELNDFADR